MGTSKKLAKKVVRKYGTVKVPGVASVCHKISMNDLANLPKGYRVVGSGSSYLYITNGQDTEKNDVLFRLTVTDPSGQARKEVCWDGKTRAQVTTILNKVAAKFLNDKKGMVVEALTTPGYTLKMEYRQP